MAFQDDSNTVRWRIHLASTPQKVFKTLSTDEGRALFWAESAVATDGEIHFKFPNGWTWRGKLIESRPSQRLVVEYIGGSLVTFELIDDGAGGTDLMLTDAGVPAADRTEVIAGWVSVLLALKAAVDFSVDLRCHDPKRTWDQGYADN